MNYPKHLFFILTLFIACDQKHASHTAPSSTDATHLAWQHPHPGVWRAQAGKVSDFNLLSVAKKKASEARLAKLGSEAFPLDTSAIKTFSGNGNTYLRFPLERDEQIFGLGLNFKTVHQRGRIMRLHVDHYGGEDDGRTHAPVPFFISSRGYGVLINTARYIDVYVGTGVRKDSGDPALSLDRNTDKSWTARPYSDNLEIVVPEEGVALYVFEGPTMMQAVQRFNLFCGGGIIPPKWGLGFWQRTPTLYTHEDVQEEVQAFADHNFPLDVVGLEPGWHSKAYPCTFEWDESRYPDPKTMTRSFLEQGIHLNLWMNPYISPAGSLYEKLEPFSGTHTVWTGIVPDYTLPQARKIMQNHFNRHQLDMGISGFKIDEVDGYDRWLWPDIALFPSGKDGEQMRQTYALQLMTLTDEIFRQKNQRSYGLIRAANAGSVAYPYVIYNDYYSHRDFITAVINSGFIGVLWTPEVRASESAEEWLRRMQTVCFSPLAMINAWADGTKPWSFPEVYEACREVAFLRMRLLPYLYSTFAQYYFEGKPPFRPMNLVEGFAPQESNSTGSLNATGNPYAEAVRKEVKDQYMVGDFLLVAPFFAGETTREVILPKGNWFDFYTGKYAGNGEVIDIQAEIDQIPLFVMDGGIIPMMPPIRQTSAWIQDTPLEIRMYGEADGDFTLYDDDGTSYDFEQGAYTTKQLKVSRSDGRLNGEIATLHDGGSWSYGTMTWRYMTEGN